MQLSRRSAALLSAFSALALAGCHHSDTDNSGGQLTMNGSAAVATVNGQAITQQTFYNELQDYRPAQQATGLPAGQTVLRGLISQILVQQLAQKQGVAPTQDQINALYTFQQAVNEASSVKTFDQLLAENDLTAQDYQAYQITPQLASLNLIDKGQPAITPAAISTYYTQHQAQFTEPNRAHIKRIIVATPADAQRIYGQLQKGQSFDSLVSQSIDRTFPNGDVPLWVSLDAPPSPQIVPPAMLPALKKAAAAEKASGPGPASVTPPYTSPQGGIWIVQVVDQKPKTTLPLSQVQGGIRDILMTQQIQQNPSLQAAFQQQLAQFQSQAKISIPDPRYAQLLAALTAPPLPTPQLSLPTPSAPASPVPAPKPGG